MSQGVSFDLYFHLLRVALGHDGVGDRLGLCRRGGLGRVCRWVMSICMTIRVEFHFSKNQGEI